MADTCSITAENVLLSNGITALWTYASGSSISGVNLTINGFTYVAGNDVASTFNLMNSLIVAVTSVGSPVPFNGSHNAIISSASSVFQVPAVGGGNHYLAANTFRNVGTTAISAQLLEDLKKKTTYPPLLLTSPITSNTTLSPQVQRDTDTPDLGYHYSPLDYLLSEVTVSTATLLLNNGVAVGCYGYNGLKLQNGAVLNSEGTPLNPNRLVRYRTVQENAISASEPYSNLVICEGTYSPTPLVTLRHTALSLLPSPSGSSHIKSPPSGSMTISLRDCQLQGGTLFTLTTPSLTLDVANCLFERANCYLQGSTVNLYNGTFVGAALNFQSSAGQIYTVKDNLFDGPNITWLAGTLYNSNNGYTTGTTPLPGGANNKTGLVADYQVGPLGRYYYPAAGGTTSLCNLINSGSRLSSAAGLSYYTVTTDEVKDDAASWVDIGFHYAALPKSGQYYDRDTDGDGLWDGWDYYPLDVNYWADPNAPNDGTGPVITLLAPPNVGGAP